MPDYEKLVWIYDKDGREFACPVDAIKGKVKKGSELSEDEKKKCTDVNEIVGTERW